MWRFLYNIALWWTAIWLFPLYFHVESSVQKRNNLDDIRFFDKKLQVQACIPENIQWQVDFQGVFLKDTSYHSL